MGLTIHWTLKAARVTRDQAKAKIEELRQRALDLPFQSVSDLVEFRGKACARSEKDPDNIRWLKMQVTEPIRYEIGNQTHEAMIQPTHVIAFNVFPGQGCEDANFGLCRYPKSVDEFGRTIYPGLNGWTWTSFCKTQYASNPTCGDIQNFLRCHLSIIKLLDHAKELGILKRVSDEGDYWEKRDVKALVEEVAEWNSMIAGNLGPMRDAIEAVGLNPRELEGPIADYPNYEHLEAKGREE